MNNRLAGTVAAALAVLPMFTATAQQSEDTKSFVNGEPIVRTEEDRERGKENVQNVVAELKALFDTPSAALSPRPKKLQEEPQFLNVADINGKAALIYYCRNTTASKLAQTLDPLCSNDGYVEYNTEQNKILIVDAADRVEVFKKAIVGLDAMSPQVLVEGRVVEVLLNDSMQRHLSVAVNQREQSFNSDGEKSQVVSHGGAVTDSIGPNPSDTGAMFNWFPYAGNSTNVNVAFQWLIGAQDARILSSPNIAISRGDTAKISTGQSIPIQEQSQNGSTISFSTKYRDVGVSLSVTPKIINAKTVLLNVKPEVSNILRYETITSGGVSYRVPIISVRNIDTNLTLYDGQVIMLGGLFNNSVAIDEERIPFLSDMPWVGEFFTTKSYSNETVQLLFVLRVTILNADELDSGVLYDPQQVASTSQQLGDIMAGDKQTFPDQRTTLEQVKEELKTAPGMRAFQSDLDKDEKAE
ncbi:MAG: type II secretion system protein GspD [Victivallaceae bacterium]|nr:type II and III secretion system protein [Victivallaceae bacterium]